MCLSTNLDFYPVLASANLRRTQLRNELNEVEGHQDSTNTENVALKRDKLLLTDEVANLNSKVWMFLLEFRHNSA